VGTLARLVADRTDLDDSDRRLLERVVEEWSVLADLSLSDLLLWVPTWNEGGLIVVAQVRPSTAPTSVPDDAIGMFAPRGRNPHVDQALAYGRGVRERHPERPWLPASIEAYPLTHQDRVIGVIARHASAAPRVAGRLEEIYLNCADDLFAMTVEGTFPPVEEHGPDTQAPRVGDGLVRLTAAGVVEYASPNAINAMRRLGLGRELVGSSFAEVIVRLSHRPGPVDSRLSMVAGGRSAGGADVENPGAVVALHGIPLLRESERIGALVFCRDVTDLRRRERALLSKDATIREIHHRVKNNLQTVSAMLRMQARRASSDEAREALTEAELRVGAIAIVHESLSANTGERVDFDEIVDRILALVRDLAPAYSATGKVPVLAREGSWGLLLADVATPLAMAVSELLHNSVEHAGASQIRVRLSSDEGRGLLLQVIDDGAGLPADFQMADAGLGLSIVTTLVTTELHGSCDLEGGEGTTVTVRVPLEPAG
jgi:two-component sensor histidine kinase